MHWLEDAAGLGDTEGSGMGEEVGSGDGMNEGEGITDEDGSTDGDGVGSGTVVGEGMIVGDGDGLIDGLGVVDKTDSETTNVVTELAGNSKVNRPFTTDTELIFCGGLIIGIDWSLRQTSTEPFWTPVSRNAPVCELFISSFKTTMFLLLSDA